MVGRIMKLDETHIDIMCIYIYTLGAGGSLGTPAPWVFISIYLYICIYMKLLVHCDVYTSHSTGTIDAEVVSKKAVFIIL